MSNPYAPPEDGPREAPPAPAAPAGPPPPGPAPYAGPARSPEGVPYERPVAAPQGPAPSPADVLRLGGLLRWTALLVLAAVVGDLLAFPWYLPAGIVAIVALVVGGRAVALASRTRQRAPSMVLLLLVAVAFLSLMRPVTALLTWDAESAHARCQAAALTVQAENACLTEYRQALDARVAALKHPAP